MENLNSNEHQDLCKNFEKEKKRIIKKKLIIENDNKVTIENNVNLINDEIVIDKQCDNNKIIIEKNKIYNMDCLEYLDNLHDKIINTVILDPPYYMVVKEKWDNKWNDFEDYLKWLGDIIKKIERVAKYSCSLWIFGFPYQLSFIIPICEKYGFTYRQHITINKGIRSVAGRTSSKLKMFPVATEYLIYFHKEARYVIRDILRKKQQETKKTSQEINTYLGKAINGGGTWSSIAGEKQKNLQYPTKEDWDKLDILFGGIEEKYDDYVYKFNVLQGLTDVWDDINFYEKTYKKTHPTQKPYKLIERIINCSTEKNDAVLDIFMGSGMTGFVCKNTERNFYGCELDVKYFNENLLN
jgi:site-specific DNA-methyltransferase (adenine-specific)